MLCRVDDDIRIKVGDFGLARDVYSNDYYRADKNTKLPVKWMSPEALHDNISILMTFTVDPINTYTVWFVQSINNFTV